MWCAGLALVSPAHMEGGAVDSGRHLSDRHTELNVLNISFSILVCSNMHTFSPTQFKLKKALDWL